MEEVKRTDAGEPRCRAAKGGAGRGSSSTMEEYGPWNLGIGVRVSPQPNTPKIKGRESRPAGKSCRWSIRNPVC